VVVSSYELEAHHLHLLTGACEFWDRKQTARKIIEKEGILVLDRFGQQREHPAVKVERDSGLMFAKLLRELALDVEALGEAARPPAIHGNAHLRAS
jgi:phage terminase small subunit